MKFIKGNFTVIPNLDRLVGLPPEVQTIFFWLCVHSDDQGVCFPSRKRLSFECGLNIRTLDKYLGFLEHIGIIIKTKRKKLNSKENTSNLYQIVLSQFDCEVEKETTLGSELNYTTHSEPNSTVTKSNTNYIKETKEAETSSADIPLLIKSFEKINPTASKFYGNTTQRKACQFLIDTYGFERVNTVIEKTLPKTNVLQFFPNITTPVQLQDKWANLESAVRKYQAERQTTITKNKVAF